MNNIELSCTSWLHGKHSADIEINTKIPYVAIYDFFTQGEEADKIIEEINLIYNRQELNVLQACEKWAFLYL